MTDAFFERGGGRITFADLVYRLYLVGTDYYFYLLAEHKDRLRGDYRPYLQMDGYAMRIRERGQGQASVVALVDWQWAMSPSTATMLMQCWRVVMCLMCC